MVTLHVRWSLLVAMETSMESITRKLQHAAFKHNRSAERGLTTVTGMRRAPGIRQGRFTHFGLQEPHARNSEVCPPVAVQFTEKHQLNTTTTQHN